MLAKRVAALIGSLPVTLISPGPKDHCDCCAPFGLLPKRSVRELGKSKMVSPGPKDHCDCCAPFGLLPKRSVRELGKSKMVLPGPAPRNTKLLFDMSMRFANT